MQPKQHDWPEMLYGCALGCAGNCNEALDTTARYTRLVSSLSAKGKARWKAGLVFSSQVRLPAKQPSPSPAARWTSIPKSNGNGLQVRFLSGEPLPL